MSGDEEDGEYDNEEDIGQDIADYDGIEAEDDDQFENITTARTSNVWSSGGHKRNIIVRKLIKCFSSMVDSVPRD